MREYDDNLTYINSMSYTYRILFYNTLYTNADIMAELMNILSLKLNAKDISINLESRSFNIIMDNDIYISEYDKYYNAISESLLEVYNNNRDLIISIIKSSNNPACLFETLCEVSKYMYNVNILNESVILQL